MENLLILAAGLLPALLLLGFILYKDRKQPEPVSKLLLGVFYGVLSALVAGCIEIPVQGLIEPIRYVPIMGSLCDAFLVAAIPEEAVKLFFVWLLVRKNPYFDERMDGIVYCVCVGLGFAAFENVLYLFDEEDWRSLALMRGLLSVPGHYGFAILMGTFYGLYHFEPIRYKHLRAFIIIAPVLAHGIYDFLCFFSSELGDAAYLGTLVIFYFCFRMHKYCYGRVTLALKKDREVNLTESNVLT